MSQHNDEIRFRHILDHSREALGMIQGKKRSDLDSNRMLELSLVRLVEIIGEAATRVGAESREKYPSIPWLQIIGMRNRLRCFLRDPLLGLQPICSFFTALPILFRSSAFVIKTSLAIAYEAKFQ